MEGRIMSHRHLPRPVFWPRLIGWTAVFMTFAIVLVGNWISTVMDPHQCPAGLVCVSQR